MIDDGVIVKRLDPRPAILATNAGISFKRLPPSTSAFLGFFRIIRYSADDARLADTGVALNLKEVPGSPAQLILARGERYAYLRSPDSRGSIYEADMERGKVVQQWTAPRRQLKFNHIEHSRKGAQASEDCTFVALTDTSLHRFDARVPGGVVQTAELQELASQEYAAVQGLTCCRATGDGRLAVGFEDGSVRLYPANRLGPAMTRIKGASWGPVTSLDVSFDGKWVLATTARCLLLVCAEADNTSAFSARLVSRLQEPRRLQLSDADTASIGRQSLEGGHFTLVTEQGREEQYVFAKCGRHSLRWSFRAIKAAQVPEGGAALRVSYKATPYSQQLVGLAAMHDSHPGTQAMAVTAQQIYREADQLP